MSSTSISAVAGSASRCACGTAGSVKCSTRPDASATRLPQQPVAEDRARLRSLEPASHGVHRLQRRARTIAEESEPVRHVELEVRWTTADLQIAHAEKTRLEDRAPYFVLQQLQGERLLDTCRRRVAGRDSHQL